MRSGFETTGSPPPTSMIVSTPRWRNVSRRPLSIDVVPGRIRRQVAVRDGDGQVEPGLGGGVAQDLLVQAVVHEQVRADAEQDRGQRDERDEGDGEARPDPVHQRSPPQRAAL